jgi:hypothetical protein
MTSIAQQPPTAPLRVQDVRLRRVLVSEWIKLWSLRSTVLTLLAAVVAMVVVGCLASWAFVDNWDELTPAERAGFNPIDPALVGVNLAQLAVGVLGVLLITGEYATGMIRATLSAVPTRLPGAVGQGGLYAAVTFVLDGRHVAGRLPEGAAASSVKRAPTSAWPSCHGAARHGRLPDRHRRPRGSARFPAAQHGGGIATLLRAAARRPDARPAAALQLAGRFLPYLPNYAGSAVTTVRPQDGLLSVTGGVVVLARGR